MIYSLDTNVIVRALRGVGAEGIRQRLQAESASHIVVPEMVRAELLTGARKSARPAHHLALVNRFLEAFKLLPFAGEAVEHYADIRVTLERAGESIGSNDLIIAATARAAGAIVVTNNLSEFSRVPGLRCEDWPSP